MARTLPRLVKTLTDRQATFAQGKTAVRVRVGDEVGDWTLRAAWAEDGVSLAALESPDEICIVGTETPRVRARMHRPFGALQSLSERDVPTYQREYYDELMQAQTDLLAARVARKGEPSFAAVADLLPPVMSMTFVGDHRAHERAIVRPDGAVENRFEPVFELDTEDRAGHFSHGLLARDMNALCYGSYDEDKSEGVELLVFALADGPSGELSVYRRVRRLDAEGEAVFHERHCSDAQPVSWQFYAALLRAHARDKQLSATGAQIEVPEPTVRDIIRASSLLGDLTFRGVLPKYGVGYYAEAHHDSFPPSLVFLVWLHLEWGRLARARDLLSHYLSRRVNEEGAFDYYGPAVAEYGQVLSLCARYVQLSGDRAWWNTYLLIIRRVFRRLIALREASCADDPLHKGLIPGLPEADYHQQEGEWDKYYFSGDVWVCRGLRQVGKVLTRDADTKAEGLTLIEESRAYEKDIRRAVKAATDREAGFVPAGPDEPGPFESMTESRHASYCNYRYLLEMVSAGILDDATVRRIARYRRAHGGELVGMTRFMDHLDDWPTWHYARGLLDVDDVAGYLMTFYGHLAHHHSRGNWASYEQVWIRPEAGALRSHHGRAEQVVPCQVMGPIMLKHMLVDEQPDEEVLHLLRACPRAWLASLQGVQACDVPTRWGPISLCTRCEGGELTVDIEAGFSQGAPERVVLRVPVGPEALAAVKVNGRTHAQIDPRKLAVILTPKGAWQAWRVIVACKA